MGKTSPAGPTRSAEPFLKISRCRVGPLLFHRCGRTSPARSCSPPRPSSTSKVRCSNDPTRRITPAVARGPGSNARSASAPIVAVGLAQHWPSQQREQAASSTAYPWLQLAADPSHWPPACSPSPPCGRFCVGCARPPAHPSCSSQRVAVSSPTATHSPRLTSPIPHQMTPADLRSPTFTPRGRSSATSTSHRIVAIRVIGHLPPPGLAVCLPRSTHRPFSNWNRITPVSVGLCFVVSGVVLRPGRM